MSAETPAERQKAVDAIAIRMCAQAGLPHRLWDAFLTEAWLEYLGSDVSGKFEAPKSWSLEEDQKKGDQSA